MKYSGRGLEKNDINTPSWNRNPVALYINYHSAERLLRNENPYLWQEIINT
jgi:hypothetical protein